MILLSSDKFNKMFNIQRKLMPAQYTDMQLSISIYINFNYYWKKKYFYRKNSEKLEGKFSFCDYILSIKKDNLKTKKTPSRPFRMMNGNLFQKRFLSEIEHRSKLHLVELFKNNLLLYVVLIMTSLIFFW